MVLGPQGTNLIKLKLAASKAIFTYVEPIFETCSYLTRQAVIARQRLASMN